MVRVQRYNVGSGGIFTAAFRKERERESEGEIERARERERASRSSSSNSRVRQYYDIMLYLLWYLSTNDFAHWSFGLPVGRGLCGDNRLLWIAVELKIAANNGCA